MMQSWKILNTNKWRRNYRFNLANGNVRSQIAISKLYIPSHVLTLLIKWNINHHKLKFVAVS